MALSIPLPILLGLVVVGLVGTVGILHAIGWAETARIDDASAARRIFAMDHPDDEVVDAVVTADGAGALMWLADHTLALVSVLGDRFVVRKLRPGTLAGLRIEPAQVVLVFRDVSFPRVTLALAEGEERSRWTLHLTACASTASRT